MLKEDPNVIDCVRVTSMGRAKLNINRPWIAYIKIINNSGGDIIYYTNDHLGHLCLCSTCCDAQYPLSDISRVEFIQGNDIAIFQNESIILPRGNSSGTGMGVRITTKQSDGGYYDIIAFGSLDAQRFARGLVSFARHAGGASTQHDQFNDETKI